MAQDPPEDTWAVDAVVVGVVVAGVNVVVDALALELEAVELEAVELEALELEALAVEAAEVEAAEVEAAVVDEAEVDEAAEVALAARCEVWADARPAKRPTPATDAAATAPVIRRVRRRIESLEAEEFMGSLSGARLGGT